MNLRDFKKDIEYFVGEFIDDCTTFLSLKKGTETEKVSALIEEAVDLYNELKDKANAKVEGPKGQYFQGLRIELSDSVDALYSKLSDIIAGKVQSAE